MKTIQMTIDDELLQKLDSATKRFNTNRSAFIRDSVLYYLKKLQTEELEERHRQGYKKFPATTDEFGNWENEQIWGD